MRVLVTGGAGFLGRHVVAALTAAGHDVVIGSRKSAGRASALQLRRTQFEKLTSAAAWDRLLGDVDAVVNCVGILREVGAANYDRVHHQAPAALAAACCVKRLRFVHVSALGLDAAARSGFITSKRRGEAAIRASGADYTIVRPSLLDGEGGFGARWVRRLAQWPVHFVPRDATGRIAALDVEDAARAIARLVAMAAKDCREVELGGSDWRTFEAHLAAMRLSNAPPLVVHVPRLVARMASHVCDLVHATPFSFGHLELLRRDNVPAHDWLPSLLGRAPRSVMAAQERVPEVAPAIRRA